VRTNHRREALFQPVDDGGGIRHRQRGLRHVSQVAGVARLEAVGVLDRLD